MAKPPAHGHDINTRLNSSRCEKMSQIVMRESLYSELETSGINSFLAFGDRKNIVAVSPFWVPDSARVRFEIIEQLGKSPG